MFLVVPPKLVMKPRLGRYGPRGLQGRRDKRKLRWWYKIVSMPF